MKCPQCDATINGFTGLQEAQAFQKHLKKKHNSSANLLQAVEQRARSGQ